MSTDDKHLSEYLKQFLQDALAMCMDELHKNEAEYTKLTRIPIVENHRLCDIRQEECVDYNKLVHVLKSNIKKHRNADALFKIIQNLLKQRIKFYKELNSAELILSIDQLANQQIFKFVLYYLKRHEKYNTVSFKRALQIFLRHVGDDLFFQYYLVPIYNVEGNFKQVQLLDNFWIRQIKLDELAKIANVQHLPFKAVSSYDARLQFVLICKLPVAKENCSVALALESFERAVNFLKLFKNGNPQLGDLYLFESNSLVVDELHLISRNRTAYVPSTKTTLNASEIKAFAHFYTNLHLNLDKSTTKFLDLAINRFGLAANHQDRTNSVIDYVISLETLLGSGGGEITLKLAHRVAAILGQNDDHRLCLWQFMREAYNFRSGILHESEPRKFKINSQTLSIAEISNELQLMSRVAILKMIDLLEVYSSKKQILSVLDKCMYDRKLLRYIKNHKHTIKLNQTVLINQSTSPNRLIQN